ncbi:cytochrome P450 [Aestuariicella hydrocarbonica]|uniref:Cytochrome P450 n=1 Tax=Pseudomaricurvus hydrocarbonicus TaxID=1470433 RepID=A0A9E5JZS4_9GAMM|nr:cytochrome P450 [Aestuariicella hydrocarbonica]NHO65702.1 cytochrome P450 [Aestuariicella hydrocarbonica]
MESSEVYYDPYSREIVEQPYPVYQRLRQEAPLYYNKKYDFYAVSRYEDVRKGLGDHETFISSRGGILEMIQQNIQMPAGTFIFEDKPRHTMYRQIAQRLFTPRRMMNLEPMVRKLAAQVLDPLVERDEFDFIHDVGRELPMRVIGMLMGIPESDFQSVREITDSKMRTEEGKPLDYGEGLQLEQSFDKYIDWREKNPGDDVTTELINVEFTDETGTLRKLTREELVTFFNVLAGAGNETTNRLIGWVAKALAEHPKQRRELVKSPSLIPDAIEEVLRLEPPGPHVARYVAKDVEIQGQTVPAGSAILFLVGSANHDERIFPNPDHFDLYRGRTPSHVTFGYGIHTCIGNVLARLEGRVVFEELLKRIPDWDVDMEHAKLLSTSTVRGWDTLPAYVNARGAQTIKDRAVQQAQQNAASSASAPATLDGEWVVTVKGPTGPMDSSLALTTTDGVLGGEQTGEGTTTVIEEIAYNPATGDVTWINKISKPMKMTLKFTGKVEGNSMSGKVKAGFMGSFAFTGQKP